MCVRVCVFVMNFNIVHLLCHSFIFFYFLFDRSLVKQSHTYESLQGLKIFQKSTQIVTLDLKLLIPNQQF